MIEGAVVPVVGFVGFRGAGKTTLLTRLIPLLHARGLRVGVVKQASPMFELDQPGKDSFKLRKAGADQTLVASPKRWALIVETPPSTQESQLGALLGHLEQESLDLILVEGFAGEQFPKIEVHRPALGRPLLCLEDRSMIALATDQAPESELPLPVLSLNDPERIVAFVCEEFIDGREQNRPR